MNNVSTRHAIITEPRLSLGSPALKVCNGATCVKKYCSKKTDFNKYSIARIFLLYVLVILVLCAVCPAAYAEDPASLKDASSENAASNFAVPSPNYDWQFPRDHGAHRKFQTEWWYFTGQLFEVPSSASGAAKQVFVDPADYGFQLTFFRRALFAKPLESTRSDGILAHAALSDIRAQKFLHEKKYQRAGLLEGAAQPSESTLNVKLGDWQAVLDDVSGVISLTYNVGDVSISLAARPTTSIMFQGDRGLSRKGNCASCASHYYSLPRLELSGFVIKAGVKVAVTGIGWMDHEFMSNALEASQAGWDWFSIMTRSGESIMYFRLRERDSARKDFSACSIMANGAAPRSCEASIVALNTWQSPRSGARYPQTVKLVVDGREILLTPLMPDQELFDSSMAYYEGAVATADNSAIGYMELTGYDKPLEQRL